MANTYSQCYFHVTFHVKSNRFLIPKHLLPELFKYTTGIVQGKKHKMIAIGGIPDHIHLFVGLRPDVAISDLVHDVKGTTSKFLNEKFYATGQFRWQKGFGVFTYSRSQIRNVANYIHNQEKHHEKKSFKEEYIEILNRFDVDYDPKYLFDYTEDPDDQIPNKKNS